MFKKNIPNSHGTMKDPELPNNPEIKEQSWRYHTS